MDSITKFFGAAAIVVATSTAAQTNDNTTDQTNAPTPSSLALQCERSDIHTVGDFEACFLAIIRAYEPVESVRQDPALKPRIDELNQLYTSCAGIESLYNNFSSTVSNRIKDIDYASRSNAPILHEELEMFIDMQEQQKLCVDEVDARLDKDGETAHKDAYKNYGRALSEAINALTLD